MGDCRLMDRSGFDCVQCDTSTPAPLREGCLMGRGCLEQRQSGQTAFVDLPARISPVKLNLKEHGKDEKVQAYGIDGEEDAHPPVAQDETGEHVQHTLERVESIEGARLLLGNECDC